MTIQDMKLEIGRNIACLLDKYDMTQKELVDEMGVSKQIISAYIRGDRQPSVKNLINIAYVIGCDINEIVAIDDLIE